MPAPVRPATVERAVRLLRLMAAFAVIVALVAVVTIIKGGPADRSQALVSAAVILGGGALLGLAIAAWPYRQKVKNDPRP